MIELMLAVHLALAPPESGASVTIATRAYAADCYKHAVGGETSEKAVRRCDEAIAYYTDVRNNPRRRHGAYVNRGVIHYNAGRYEKAISDYSFVVENGRPNSKVYSNRGLAYEQLAQRSAEANRWERLAAADYRTALAADPNNALAARRLEELAKPRLERRPLRQRIVT